MLGGGQLSADSVTDSIQHVDQIGGRLCFTKKRDTRQHLHLFVGDVVDALKILVVQE
jgi:hypothetical protein